jgi:hypothetical protein
MAVFYYTTNGFLCKLQKLCSWGAPAATNQKHYLCSLTGRSEQEGRKARFRIILLLCRLSVYLGWKFDLQHSFLHKNVIWYRTKRCTRLPPNDSVTFSILPKFSLKIQIFCFWTLSIAPFFYVKHRPVYISKHNVSETGFCLRLRVKPTQLSPIDRARLEFGTSSIDWAQLSKFCPKTEIESSLRNVVFWNINRTVFYIKTWTWIMSRNIIFVFFSEYFGFPCQSSFHQLLHNHPHLSSGAVQ